MRTLAVALGHRVYLWTEKQGVRYPPLPSARVSNYVSSLAFSSVPGGRAILAVARNSGYVTLWSLLEPKPRFEVPHPWAACCVAFKPITTMRHVAGSSDVAACEDLLVGDDSGHLYYYSVHWDGFATGSMALLTKLDAHSQNICALAWSPDGKTFVSGGNDNSALLFEVDSVLKDFEYTEEKNDDEEKRLEFARSRRTVSGLLTPPPERPLREAGPSPYGIGRRSMIEQFGITEASTLAFRILSPTSENDLEEPRGRTRIRSPQTGDRTRSISWDRWPNSRKRLQNHLANPRIKGKRLLHKNSFYHSAAVKAIAYAPWQPTLLATGGGSNDRQIHFHHAGSGSTLAVINVFAQVTSLSWSRTSREIVATFGYAQPEHNIRIAVFAWPSCECVVGIPWERKSNGEIGRALWAIPYPGGPNDATLSKDVPDSESEV